MIGASRLRPRSAANTSSVTAQAGQGAVLSHSTERTSRPAGVRSHLIDANSHVVDVCRHVGDLRTH